MIEAPCTLCAGSARKGLLWLRGADYLECPDCGGTGVFKAHADLFNPRERTVSMAGVGSFIERRHHPSIAHLQDAVECRFTA